MGGGGVQKRRNHKGENMGVGGGYKSAGITRGGNIGGGGYKSAGITGGDTWEGGSRGQEVVKGCNTSQSKAREPKAT